MRRQSVLLLTRLLAGLMWSLFCGAQACAATYSFRSDTFQWESANTAVTWARACTSHPGDDDQATITFTGGFTFNFAGTAYSSVRVLTNGMLQFGADTGFFRNFTNSRLPAGSATARSGCAAAPTTLTMMAYWADLDPGASKASGGGVFWEQKGTAPDRYVVVTWQSVFQYSTATPYTFQIILYENGQFKYQYGNANASGSNATIGVQVSSTDYSLYSFNSGYNANGSAIRWLVPSSTPQRVAEYRLDGHSLTGAVGEVRDSSGNNQHGVRVGGALSIVNGYVCRGVEIPRNTDSSISAIDTLLSLPSAVGRVGSVSLWWRYAQNWNNTNPAVVFDATQTPTRPFYLQRNGGGQLRFAVSDSAGAVLVATTASNAFSASTWVHVTATWRLASGSNQSTLRVFVNGSLAATTIGTTNGTLDAGQGTLFIGDNRSAGAPSGGSLSSADGRIDEVRLSNFDQGPAEIAADMALIQACLPPVDHYELSLSSGSLACLATPVTVTACADTSSPCTSLATTVNGQTATLSASAGLLASTTITFNSTGVATTTLSHATAANGTSVSVTLSGEQTAATNARQCCANGTACSVANSCSTTFNSAGFIVAAAAGGAEATVPAQTAGTASAAYFLRAVQTSTSTKACEAAITGVGNVNWSYQCNNPSSCSASNLMTLNGNGAVTIARNDNGSTASSTAVPMTFDANGNAPFTFNYADVGQVTLNASRAASGALLSTLSGATNAFVVRPGGFALSAIRQTAAPLLVNPAAANDAGAKFVKAGEAFSATVTARTSGGATTPNYGRETSPEGVLLTHALVLPSPGTAGTLSNSTIAGGSFTSGVATVTNLAFSEVGIITLRPTVGDGSYLGAGDTNGTATGNIGRFFPARFGLSAGSVLHRAGLGCAPASAFSYLGENFVLGLTLTAQNAAGATTTNYTGSFAKLNPNSANWNLAGRDATTVFNVASTRLSVGSATGSFINGVASGITLIANAARATTPDGPFSAAFGVAPLDSDGVTMAAFDMASASGGSNDRALVASVPLRFGRLRVSSAVGAADRALVLPVTAQHWNGTAFDTNTLDSCTAIATTAMNFGNLRGTLTTADTAASGAITLTGGVGSLRLAAPGGGRSGTYDVALSLGSGSTDASCLQSWTPGAGDAATAGASLAYLRGNFCAATYGNDPAARATFGRPRGVDSLVYRRENF